MSWVAAGVASAQLTFAGVQAYRGWRQKKKGEEQLQDLKQPKYSTPESLEEGHEKAKGMWAQNISSAKHRVVEGLPEAIKQQFIQKLDRGTASGLAFAGKRGRGLAGLEDIQQARVEGAGDIATMEAQSQLQAEQDLANARIGMASASVQEGRDLATQEERGFNINQFQPWAMKYGQAQAMMGAGAQNIDTGMQTGVQGVQQFGTGYAAQQD